MLFSNLHALLKRGVTINLILGAAGDEKIEVTVLPSSEKSFAGTQLVAKTFVATPQELDEQFAGVMAGYAVANLSLQDQLQAMQKQADEAAEAAKEAVKKPSAKPASNVATKPAAGVKPALLDGDAEDDDDVPSSGSEGSSAGGQADLISL